MINEVILTLLIYILFSSLLLSLCDSMPGLAKYIVMFILIYLIYLTI